MKVWRTCPRTLASKWALLSSPQQLQWLSFALIPASPRACVTADKSSNTPAKWTAPSSPCAGFPRNKTFGLELVPW